MLHRSIEPHRAWDAPSARVSFLLHGVIVTIWANLRHLRLDLRTGRFLRHGSKNCPVVSLYELGDAFVAPTRIYRTSPRLGCPVGARFVPSARRHRRHNLGKSASFAARSADREILAPRVEELSRWRPFVNWATHASPLHGYARYKAGTACLGVLWAAFSSFGHTGCWRCHGIDLIGSRFVPLIGRPLHCHETFNPHLERHPGHKTAIVLAVLEDTRALWRRLLRPANSAGPGTIRRRGGLESGHPVRDSGHPVRAGHVLPQRPPGRVAGATPLEGLQRNLAHHPDGLRGVGDSIRHPVHFGGGIAGPAWGTDRRSDPLSAPGGDSCVGP